MLINEESFGYWLGGGLLAAGGVAGLARWLRGKTPRVAPTAKEPPLWMLTPNDPLTLHQCYEGVFACGATGSGKTSTLAHLMSAMMKRGCGMLLLTAKSSDFQDIEKIAREAGRATDLFRFGPGKPWRFDFLKYELASKGGSVANAAQLMHDLVDVSTRTKSENSRDPFWPNASSRQIKVGLTALEKATGTASVRELYRFITSLPPNPAQAASEEWRNSAFCFQVLKQAVALHPHNADLALAADYVMLEYPALGERTGPNITTTTMNVLEKLVAGEMGALIASGETNLSPDDWLDGRIIVIDTPALVHREAGQYAQLVWKLSAIRAALRRDLSVNDRPVILWVDECQLHAVPSVDSMFQAVARSHRCGHIAISQNIDLLQSRFGSKEDTHAWLSNLQTKLVFANTGSTNDYFSALFGSSKQLMMGGGSSAKPYDPIAEWMGEPGGGSAHFSEQWQPDVRPEDFTSLRKGGTENNLIVDAYVFQGGRRWSNRKPWLRSAFRQRV